MELPTWKGAYYPRHVNSLSVRLFNHARGVLWQVFGQATPATAGPREPILTY